MALVNAETDPAVADSHRFRALSALTAEALDAFFKTRDAIPQIDDLLTPGFERNARRNQFAFFGEVFGHIALYSFEATLVDGIELTSRRDDTASEDIAEYGG